MNVLTVFLFFFLILEIYLNFQNNLLILFFPLCFFLNLTFYQLLYKVWNLFSSKISYATIFIAYFLKKEPYKTLIFQYLYGFSFMVQMAGIEPARFIQPQDFKSCASASSATSAFI